MTVTMIASVMLLTQELQQASTRKKLQTVSAGRGQMSMMTGDDGTSETYKEPRQIRQVARCWLIHRQHIQMNSCRLSSPKKSESVSAMSPTG